jgi:hypothetical protein
VYDDSEDEDGHDGEEMDMPALGHDGEGGEGTPTIIEALVGKKVIGTAAGSLTQQRGPTRGSSSPLGLECLGSWATEGIRMSFCRG